VRQPEKANAILSVRDLRREQIVWIGGLASRQGRTIVKTGQMDVITTEILSIAIHVVEHPSEGILTARPRPFVQVISGEKQLSLR